jgi:hypothetical protein
MGDTLLDEIIYHAGDIVPALAKSLPDQSKRITKFVENLQEKNPEIAKRLLDASVICK